MEAKGKNEVADTMDTIKKIVEDIPYLKLEKEQEEYCLLYTSRCV